MKSTSSARRAWRAAACGTLFGVFTFTVALSAHAAQAPTAGDALRDIQDKPIPAPAGKAPVDITRPVPRAVAPVAGLKVDVKGFRFSGVRAADEKALREVVAPFVGRDKTFDDLQAAAEAVSEYLQREGYFVAQAYLPEQELAGGVVEIAVLEGRLGEVKLEIEDGVPVRRSMIAKYLARLERGQVMHRDSVERVLFLISDLRGVNVRSVVEPGASPGTSNLIVKVSAGRRFDALIEFDNHSSRFTGDYRLGAGLNVNSPLGLGDLLSVRGLLGVPGGGADLDFGRVSYLVPVGGYGTKVGVAYLRVQYHLGTSLFDPLDQSGTSSVASLFALHPVVRTRNLNVFGQASFDARDFHDDRRAVGLTSDRKTKVGGLGLVGDSRDAWLGGGINNFALTYNRGRLDIETPADFIADQSTTGRHTAGSYGRINGSIARLNALWKGAVLYTSYAFQWASKNLDSSEKIALGGPTGVRAYAVGESASDEGHLATVELRVGLPDIEWLPGLGVASVFYDYAHGTVSKHPLPLDINNKRTLRGVGLGLTWARQDDFLVRATLAWRLTDPSTSDPADRKPRLFFQLQKYL
ncbi:MAG TPA: ShlB/FhaC/HecB family hemolysin secretion/activation protein [Burkholderiales bacterium]|nr:ShlB/FhaC/HecB family hemolysin secretion/activation protein [Burkholderiales bacterium]